MEHGILIVFIIAFLGVMWPLWGYYFFIGSAVLIDLYLWHFLPWTSELSRSFYGTWSELGFQLFGLGQWTSPIDLMLVTLTIGCTARRNECNDGFAPTALILTSIIVLASLIVMVAYGISTGGDARIAVWQARPYVYLVCLGLLTPAVLRTSNQLLGAVAILVGGAIFKAFQIIWIFLFEAGGKFGEWREILGHEDSLFIVAAVSLIGSLALLRVSFRGALLLFLCLPILLLGLILNLRRAGYVALALSAVLAAFLFYHRGRTMLMIAGSLFVCGGIYSVLFWNSEALVAIPLLKLKSIIFASAGTADASSNLYRVIENANLLQTIRNHPFGLGFGHPFETQIKLPDVGAIVPNWPYFPHNVFLGLWAFMGPAGLALLLFYISLSLAFAGHILRDAQDGVKQSVAFFVISILASAIVMGTVDQFVWGQRGTIFLGAGVGILFVIDRVRRNVGERLKDAQRPRASEAGGR